MIHCKSGEKREILITKLKFKTRLTMRLLSIIEEYGFLHFVRLSFDRPFLKGYSAHS
jgi:hypothetical protein